MITLEKPFIVPQIIWKKKPRNTFPVELVIVKSFLYEVIILWLNTTLKAKGYCNTERQQERKYQDMLVSFCYIFFYPIDSLDVFLKYIVLNSWNFKRCLITTVTSEASLILLQKAKSWLRHDYRSLKSSLRLPSIL